MMAKSQLTERKQMKKLIVLVVLLPFAAPAQDRTVTVKEAGVVATGADVTIQADGGCLLQARGTVDAGVAIEAKPHSFNGPRCTTVKNALLACLKKDLGVGDGAEP